jgi:two-component system sensor kinase FixL
MLPASQPLPQDPFFQRVLAAMSRSASPKFLLIGPRLLTYFNEAFAEIGPGAAPSSCGKPLAVLLPEVWGQLSDPVLKALAGADRICAELIVDPSSEPARRGPCYKAYLTPMEGEHGAERAVLVDLHKAAEGHALSQRLLVENRDLQKLLDEMPVLIAYGLGPDLRLHFVNNAFRAFFGFRPLDGLTVAEAIPEAVEQGFDRILAKVMTAGEAFVGHAMPVRLRHAGQETVRFVDFIYQPVRDALGQVVGVMCTGVDVTERHTMRQAAERLQHRALHASRINAMGTMAMTLAHELNQPLAAATSYLAAARRTGLARQQAHDATRQDCQLEESLALIDLGLEQIRRAGQIIRGLTPLLLTGRSARRPVKVAQAAENAMSILAAGRPDPLAMTVTIAPGGEYVLADKIQIEQVLVNLFRNAAEASKLAPRKALEISSRPAAGNRVRIGVRDFARGIAPGELEHVFEIGKEVKGSGLGIGLPLSRTLVEANGGTLSAAHATGGGAQFWLELDGAQAEDAQNDPSGETARDIS